MARYTGAVCKLCRREGKKLFLKGERCYTGKCSIERRAYAPGQHGQSRKKTSEYGLQLRAKQQARRFYGIQEGQFHKYFLMAERKQGITGENLLRICESRIDNVVYLLGWSSSRAEGRQLVNHGHFRVNGHKVDIASYLLKAGDVVSIKEKSRQNDKIQAIIEANAARPVPKWLEISADRFEAKVVSLPEREDMTVPVEEHLIVEYYSK
ncbi:MAG TPA: 30S ribosomal protein S4 [Clostridiales bacterium]|mgnify:CR=1 FL=1|nr:MAG: 30S ribosomal protein S4 [Firmicutes bacterium ADurb.Bin262]HOU11216.1 30S ribosomal protein S4 [Clostridiales bacterium]HQH64516.1 30S ribosomal protein S4 [Clostridiales bacterium]HQK72500.1 30S ribosomal protein S4 [Clostridiales bacterium]